MPYVSTARCGSDCDALATMRFVTRDLRTLSLGSLEALPLFRSALLLSRSTFLLRRSAFFLSLGFLPLRLSLLAIPHLHGFHNGVVAHYLRLAYFPLLHVLPGLFLIVLRT